MKKTKPLKNKKFIAVMSVLLSALLVSYIFLGVNYDNYNKAQQGYTKFNTKKWMSMLPDNMYLGDINIPGSHDAAAINTVCKDAFARHYTTINEQLEFGIRLFDIRLQYKKNKNGGFDFLTCHGKIGSAISRNTYKPFETVLNECELFLRKNPSETIILSLKVDDNKLKTDEEFNQANQALKALLSEYSVRKYQKNIGNLGSARGKIVLFNRINYDLDLGYPMKWAKNFDGITAASYKSEEKERIFRVGVQDHFNFGMNVNDFNSLKANNFFDAVNSFEKKEYDVLWNFASACTLYVFATSPYSEIMKRFSKMETNERPQHIGWVLMDYEDKLYKTDKYGNISFVSFIIDSNPLNNEAYSNYPEKFEIK